MKVMCLSKFHFQILSKSDESRQCCNHQVPPLFIYQIHRYGAIKQVSDSINRLSLIIVRSEEKFRQLNGNEAPCPKSKDSSTATFVSDVPISSSMSVDESDASDEKAEEGVE